MTEYSKDSMCAEGIAHMLKFCSVNNIEPPDVVSIPRSKWYFSVCAYYRPTTINLCLTKCAGIGRAGMAWSFPGYTVDRTPFGVIQHELGHHVDVMNGELMGGYFSTFSRDLRAEVGEAKLTNYCPNDAEWFAELFRLFVTNPDLLRLIRPRTYEALIDRGFIPSEDRHWKAVLSDAPERTINAAKNKVRKET